MERTPKERVIFDADVYDEDFLREYLSDDYEMYKDELEVDFDTYVEERSDRLFEVRDEDYREEMAALTSYFQGKPSDMSSEISEQAGNPIIVSGTIGRWGGTRSGLTVYKSFEDAIDTSPSWHDGNNVFADCEIQKVWDENGHLFIHGAHHDGSVTVELRQLSDAGAEAYEAISDAWVGEPFEANGKTYDGSDRSLTEAVRDLWEATEPPRYMERAFGCPAEEWEEPGRDTRVPDIITGRWRVHLVMPGDPYGRGNALTYEHAEAKRYGGGLPLVEFYDISQDPAAFPGGQFVSRYYMSTLLGTDNLKIGSPIREMSALSLDGGVPSWTIAGDDLKRVSDWLDAAYETLGGEKRTDTSVSLADMARDNRDASHALAEGRAAVAPDRDEQAK